ncbi:MAG: CHAP domain-containing protein [Candidatus Heteroscillospira sp.]
MKKSFKQRSLCAVLILLTAISIAVPVSAADREWESAYADTIGSCADSWGNYFALTDLDLDGAPELLIGGVPGSGLFSLADDAFTFKDGTVQALSFDEDNLGIPLDGYTLWYNASTGKHRVNGDILMRAGWAERSTSLSEFSLSGTEITDTSRFAVVTSVNSAYNESNTYYKDSKPVSYQIYTTQLGAYKYGWKQIGEQHGVTLMKSYGKLSSAEISDFIASYEDGPVIAVPSTHKVAVDGKPVQLSAYNIGGNNYFKLRDIAVALNGTGSQFQIGWDNATRTIALTTGESYTPVGGEMASIPMLNCLGLPNRDPIYIDGELVDNLTAYNINDNNYFKLRDLGEVLNFALEWDNETKTIHILTENWDAKVGTTVAAIKDGSGYTYCYNSDGNISAAGGYIGQCTWYAYGRFQETTGIALKSARNAQKWLSDNASDSRVEIVSDITAPAVAVRTSGSFGHVMFVEHVEYDADGNPTDVYFTECNWDNNGAYNEGSDCVVQKMSYNEFTRSRNPAGYITAAGN